ncbi:hypothetical protein [Poseidonocella sedimentorum]|uniref:Uncharacterized protein n=1 Tax=Poseidonocella sedimentorum TaxID=871652 RepID=A0A1I6EJW1_9RHOB|nr:hypothetical protein [Poseidonocella sedimentorum]SFR17985.1 hypothetical protein SAMN04515673_11329 [Poseidonocella sedimentorum]
MNRALPLFAIGLIFGGGLGFTLAAGYGITFDGHDHGDPAHHGAAAQAPHASHDHGALIEVAPAGRPTLDLEIFPDPSNGWNLKLITENFTFAPQNASRANASGEGHAHVYANGVKLGRVYGNWVHLDGLPQGEVDITVSLNANDHSGLAVNGAPIAASVTIENRARANLK